LHNRRMPDLRIMVSRHSAFYSPLICTIAAGFLEREGLAASYAVLAPGQRSHILIREGEVDVMQSAVSSNWGPMERGESPLPVHFAQINRRDGFFLVARRADPHFQWSALEGKEVLADHALQPLAMLRYAVHHNGVVWDSIRTVDAGAPEAMEAAFRGGQGDYVHLQSPAAHRLEQDGAGHVVVSVGHSIPPVAFSSLCASREFVAGERGRAFLRAYGAAREWTRESPADEVAATIAGHFPESSLPVLAKAISAYQHLGCWDGSVEIPRDLYTQSIRVFDHAGAIARHHPYDEVCLTAL
jgi:NitT/TauT family transport system substrate-binding protein